MRFHEQQMDREINLDSILALEKQIEGHEGHESIIIQLKRTRNSLLNVSTLPPETLGTIFRWNATPEGELGGISKGSYNFLLVCHHWFEVASSTPELWSFWGNLIQDWSHRHHRCKTAPLDLVLDGYIHWDLSDQLRGALQDRAARNTIRRVHLHGFSDTLISAIISSLSITPKGEEIRTIGVESFTVRLAGRGIVDVSAFFSQNRLPKLRCLRLSGCSISSWDLLKPQTTVLTTLELTGVAFSPTPTPSQLLSILSSNPLLQHFVLSYSPDSDIIDSDIPHARVTLRHLKQLRFDGPFRYAFRLLSQLELPDKMDDFNLFLYECSPQDLSQTVGPYFGDRIRRRGWFPGGGLWLSADHSSRIFNIATGDPCNGDDPAEAVLFAKVVTIMSVDLEDGEAERLGFDLIAHIPLERVTNLQTNLPILRSEDLCVEMCRLTYLRLICMDLSRWFIEPDIRGPRTFKDLLRGLDRIDIMKPVLGGGGWSPLTNFLTRRAAVGNQISSLRMSGHPWMSPEVVDGIKRAVKVFRVPGYKS